MEAAKVLKFSLCFNKPAPRGDAYTAPKSLMPSDWGRHDDTGRHWQQPLDCHRATNCTGPGKRLLLTTNEPWGKDCRHILAEPPLNTQGPQAEDKAHESLLPPSEAGANVSAAHQPLAAPATGSRAGGPGCGALPGLSGGALRPLSTGKSLPHDVHCDLGNQP